MDSLHVAGGGAGVATGEVGHREQHFRLCRLLRPKKSSFPLVVLDSQPSFVLENFRPLKKSLCLVYPHFCVFFLCFSYGSSLEDESASLQTLHADLAA